jgi:PAS domain S-box-containing protein
MGKVYLKIIIPSVLSILLFILTIFGFIIPRFQKNIMNGKREMIKELTNSAWSILSKYENDEQKGLTSREEAQKTAASRIEYLRYGDENKDYFWITDLHPNMIMHPYRKDLNGQNLSNFSDPQGTKLFVEFVKTVKKSGHGYVNYMWQWKEDSLHIVPKLSYVKLFEPWGWIIGTGIYIEDVKTEIKVLTKRLIWISAAISLIIALFLLFISQQSIRAEIKRAEAESDLHESKERYRTLVEAATEGLVMLSGGKISFANDVFCKMTGFENSELLHLPLREIIQENSIRDVQDTFPDSNGEEGQFDILLKKKNGGLMEVLITSSSGMINGKAVTIVIVKDITIDKNSNLTVLDYRKLLSTLNIGTFKANIDYKGRFVYANETTVRILGFDNFAQLSEIHIFNLLSESEERKNLRKDLVEKGYIKKKVIRIYKKNGETAFVAITLVLLNDGSKKEIICDGIIEDITEQESEKAEASGLIAQLKLHNFLIEQPVKDYLSPLYTIDADATISHALKMLSLHGSDNLLLTKNDKDLIGIITNSDIQRRVLSLRLQPDNPAYLIMTSPVISVNETISVIDALKICRENKIHHLVARNYSGEVSGVLRTQDIYSRLQDSLTFYISNVERAETAGQLKHEYQQLQCMLNPLIKSEVSFKYITNITSSFSDAVIRKLIESAVDELGSPPVDFTFICLGSEGRKEESLYTDQDNAIIYEDVPSGKEKHVHDYFCKLGEKVCNSLDHIGYSFCKGNIMAKNPQWCKPVSQWEKSFTSWIIAPEPQNLLEATIFFDFRNVYGDDQLTSRLRNIIGSQIAGHTLFLYHLAHDAFQTKIQHISSGSILSDKNADLVDLKHATNFFVRFARVYALQNSICGTNTLERLDALKEKNKLSEKMVNEIVFAYNFLMKLRFRNQIYLAENHLPASNLLNTRHLINAELTILKELLSFIPAYQKIIAADFRIPV